MTQFPKNPLQPDWWQRVLSFYAVARYPVRMPAASHFTLQWMRISRRTLNGSPASRQLIPAAQNVVPVAVTAGDKIESLRQWASGRCLSADRAGVYSRSEGVSGGRARRVVREPAVN